MKTAFRTMAAALLVLSITMPASASYTLNVTANLEFGGTLSGTLTFASSSSLGTVTAYDLVSSAGPGSPPFVFASYEYTMATSMVTAESSTLIRIQNVPLGVEVNLDLVSPLTASGASLTTNSFESQVNAGIRYVTTGSIFVPTAVPEPASIALTSSALAIALAGAWVRRKRASLDR